MIPVLKHAVSLLFPPKCILCGKILAPEETDLCHGCREDELRFTRSNFHLSFVARWSAVWYYRDNVRSSLLRYKFRNRRSYAHAYGRMLAMKLVTEDMDSFDTLTWVPVSRMRKFKRGYDQVELLVKALGEELGIAPVRTLRKIRNTPPQSGIHEAAFRRANVMGAYRIVNPEHIEGKRILLIDDIITTGATVSECAKTLMIAGAKEVTAAAVAVAAHEKTSPKNL